MARACAIDRVLMADNGTLGPKWFQCGTADIYSGYLVMFDDADEIKVCAAAATKVLGVAGEIAGHDMAALFTVGERVPVWMKGVEVQVTHDGVTGNATLAIEMGDYIARSGTTAGLVAIDANIDMLTIGKVTRAITIATGVPANIRILLL